MVPVRWALLADGIKCKELPSYKWNEMRQTHFWQGGSDALNSRLVNGSNKFKSLLIYGSIKLKYRWDEMHWSYCGQICRTKALYSTTNRTFLPLKAEKIFGVFVYPVQKPNSWTYNFVELSGHNLFLLSPLQCTLETVRGCVSLKKYKS